MKKVCLGLGIAFLLSFFSSTIAVADDLCGGFSTAPQCQNEPGPRFFDPQMDPRFNPEVDPRFNPQADPRFNPQADPRFNPQADPRFNPQATPCDLGIGENCSWYSDLQVQDNETYYAEASPTPYADNTSNEPAPTKQSSDESETDSGSIPVRNISLIALVIGYVYLWDSSLNLKGNINKQKNRLSRWMK